MGQSVAAALVRAGSISVGRSVGAGLVRVRSTLVVEGSTEGGAMDVGTVAVGEGGIARPQPIATPTATINKAGARFTGPRHQDSRGPVRPAGPTQGARIGASMR